MELDSEFEDRHLQMASPSTKTLYSKLKRAVLGIDKSIQPYATEKKYIGFSVNERRIAIFQIHKEHIYIWLHLKNREIADPKGIARKYDTHCSIKMADESSINEVVDLIRQSYLKNKERARKTGRV
jgi:predicted transport protein